MKAKLIVEGKEITIEIQDPELQKLLTPQKKTGYERVGAGQTYWLQDVNGKVCWDTESVCFTGDNNDYNSANYYSDETIAKNNARADKLMRQLRRFAGEHRKYEIDWTNGQMFKYYICVQHVTNEVVYECAYVVQGFNTIYFDTEEAVELAIKAFHDELVWYFTEYKDSL